MFKIKDTFTQNFRPFGLQSGTNVISFFQASKQDMNLGKLTLNEVILKTNGPRKKVLF